jgi:hypothetical protein
MPSDAELFWKEMFRPDCGMLLEIRVYGVDEVDHRSLLGLLVEHYKAVYVRDGKDQPHVPDFSVIERDFDVASVYVKFYAADVRIHFWCDGKDEMNLDVLPEDVDSYEKATGVFNLMKDVARLLNKRVLLTAENFSATQEWSEQFAFCSINPTDDEVTYHLTTKPSQEEIP